MISITELELHTSEILRNQLINSLGLPKYAYLVNNLQTTDLTAPDDKDSVKYRRIFNSFYQVRQNETWRKVYYDFFQDVKSNKDITFREVIDGLQNRLKDAGIKSFEPSFASKMLATINPNKPIWDSRVLMALQQANHCCMNILVRRSRLSGVARAACPD